MLRHRQETIFKIIVEVITVSSTETAEMVKLLENTLEQLTLA